MLLSINVTVNTKEIPNEEKKKPNNNSKQTNKSQNKQYFDRAKYGHDLDEIWNKKH